MNMKTPDGSITKLLPRLRTRDEGAIRELWRRYSGRVERLAKPIVAALEPGAGDEQDVAQSAFLALCESAAKQESADLRDRNELWRLLATISRRKAIDRVRREMRTRRGGTSKPVHAEMSEVPDGGAAPHLVAALNETLASLLQRLENDSDVRLRQVALLRFGGAAPEDIAERLGCTLRTVQRKLHILQRIWQEEIEQA